MFTPIHRALGVEPGDLTWELLDQAVAEGVQETGDLDWKQDAYDPRNPKWQDEFAKDVSAMANSGGGWLVLGVKESGPENRASEIVGVDWSAAEEQRLRRASYARTGPPVLGLDFHVLEGKGQTVVAVRVPDSADTPHFARKGQDAFVAPHRNGAHTEFMGDREIETAFRRRFSLGVQREEFLQQAYKDTAAHLDPRRGVALVMAALPNEPSGRTFGDTLRGRDALTVFSTTKRYRFLDQASDGWGSFWTDHDVRRGLRQWVTRSRSQDAYGFWKAIREDGGVLAAYQLGGLEQKETRPEHYPVGEPNQCLSSHVEHAVVDAFALLTTWAVTHEVHGGYRVRLGLVGNPDGPIYIRRKGMMSQLLPLEYSEPIHRFRPLDQDVDPLAAQEDVHRAVRDLALDVVNQGGARDLEAISEPSPPLDS